MFKKYPKVVHILLVGKQGSYKDVTAVRFCYKGLIDKGKKVYANQKLNFKYIPISTFEDLLKISGDNWNPSLLYFHDIGRIFNSRDYRKSDSEKGNTRRDLVNNLRKAGISLIGTCHRELEVDIDIRHIIDFFIYTSFHNVGDEENMEDDIVKMRWYDEPDAKENGKKPVLNSWYGRPERYAKMYNTLEKVKIL